MYSVKNLQILFSAKTCDAIKVDQPKNADSIKFEDGEESESSNDDPFTTPDVACEGATIMFTCPKGFTETDEDVLTCTDGDWDNEQFSEECGK